MALRYVCLRAFGLILFFHLNLFYFYTLHSFKSHCVMNLRLKALTLSLAQVHKQIQVRLCFTQHVVENYLKEREKIHKSVCFTSSHTHTRFQGSAKANGRKYDSFHCGRAQDTLIC